METKLDPSVVARECLTSLELLFVDTAIEAALRRVRSMRREAISPTTPAPILIASLTQREQEVMRLLAAGYRNKGVASELGISPRTVEVHRDHILKKLGVANTVELAHVIQFGGNNDSSQ